MLRCTLAVLILCALTTTGAGLWPGSAEEQRRAHALRVHFPGASDADVVARVEERGQEVEDRRTRRAAFDAFLQGIRDDLLRGGGLEPGVERLLSYCLRNYPEHLDYLVTFEPGKSLRARLARNLVRGLRSESEQRPEDSALREAVARLDGVLVRLGYDAPPEPPGGALSGCAGYPEGFVSPSALRSEVYAISTTWAGLACQSVGFISSSDTQPS